MEPKKEQVFPSPGYSFSFQITLDRKLHFNWHYHPEYELTVCRKGSGEAHIGELVYSFTGPAAFFIAPNIPHNIVSINKFDGWILQVPRSILASYNHRPEFVFISELMLKANPALVFREACSRMISDSLEMAQETSGVFRWFKILEALFTASRDEMALPSLPVYAPDDTKRTLSVEDKFGAIMHKVFNESTKTHTLTKLARSAGMSVQSFCRNFRKRVGMSFIEYLHSVRINSAKKLLQQSRMYVDDIAYECGFNNVSFFNRKFKEYTGMTPTQYRRQFSKYPHN